MAKAQVIDLFAGPGGLGEGFSGFRSAGNRKPFSIAMSVEKEPSAHQTLELRAFVRHFGVPPAAYYAYIRGEISRDELFNRYPAKARNARLETMGGPCELGTRTGDQRVFSRLKELKKSANKPFVVIGGPPCQAYSLVGRARNRGISNYDASKDRRHFLYEEYLRVLDCVEPEVFVMENVKGILSSRINGQYLFPKILEDLYCPSEAVRSRPGSRYRIYSLATGGEVIATQGQGRECIIRAEEYGVPQARHRLILLGVRENLEKEPDVLSIRSQQVTVEQAIGALPKLRSGLSQQKDTVEAWRKVVHDESKLVSRELRRRKLDTSRLDRAMQRNARLKDRGGRFVKTSGELAAPSHLEEWLIDEQLDGVPNHETRGHMSKDLGRYLFSSCHAELKDGASPRSGEFPAALVPNHRSWKSGGFTDRFKVQARNRTSSTITSHISKDGHYFIHYDPAQCRSLTVREAARLQTFPDNYFFEGNRTQQYVQVGNAVPPWLAYQIAHIVNKLF